MDITKNNMLTLEDIKRLSNLLRTDILEKEQHRGYTTKQEVHLLDKLELLKKQREIDYGKL